MSLFEIAMLVCFGAAWPLSIYKSWRSGQIAGKSLPFLFVVLAGYAAGIVHKIIYSYDFVIILYCLNFTMVAIDIALYIRNRLALVKESIHETGDRE